MLSILNNLITSLWKLLLPPPYWRVPVLFIMAIGCGLILHTFYISRAPSYFSDNPETCINCHVMRPQFATWAHSSHARNTTCNDCHVPHDNLFSKYFFKAKDGLRHSAIFTLRLEPQVIRIKEASKRVVQKNCQRCHANLIHPLAYQALGKGNTFLQEEVFCWHCHRETPHGRVNSLAATPNGQVPPWQTIWPRSPHKQRHANPK